MRPLSPTLALVVNVVGACVASAAHAQAPSCIEDTRLTPVARAALVERSTTRLRDLAERHGLAAPSVRLWVGRGQPAGARALVRAWIADQQLDPRVCLASPVACERELCAAVVAPRSVRAFSLQLRENAGRPVIVATAELGSIRAQSAQLVALSPNGHTFSSPLDGAIPAGEPGRWRVQLVLDAGDGPRPWAQQSLEVASSGSVVVGRAAPPRGPVTDARTWLVELNRRRVAAGVAALRPAPLLLALAEERARDRASRADVAHVTEPGDEPDTRLAALGVRAERIAENIASAPTLEAAFDRLEQSAAHRRIRYEPTLDSVAIAVVPSTRVARSDRRGATEAAWYVVELYATRAALVTR
ncbi:MAG: hypothetical protein JNK05_17800 [Myxococcales bacterium]|nr:hypothetical protein [Myxococcales bacterium]